MRGKLYDSTFGSMNKLQENAPKGQHHLAQGSALGRSVATRQRPVRAKSLFPEVLKMLPLQGAVALVPCNPGRCPGLAGVGLAGRFKTLPPRGRSSSFGD